MMALIVGPMVALAMLGAGGTQTNDLVSLLDARDYFNYHKIDVAPERMVELAGTKPTSPAAQIQQLLAIRWLGNHADAAQKVANARKTLEQVAAGKKAQDSLGFAKEYAHAALSRIDKKPVQAKRMMPAGSVHQDALAWFPASATIFGALDVRRTGDIEPMNMSPLRETLIKAVPAPAKPMIYQVVDRLGNVRLDRVSFAYVHDPKDKNKSQIFIRFTGLGNHKAMAEQFKQTLFGNVQTDERKGLNGEAITIVVQRNHPPAIVVIGNTDLLIVGNETMGDPIKLADLILDIRAGKKDNILKGSFADALRDVPADASGLLIGDLPEELRSELTGGGSPFKAAPKTISAVLTKDKTLNIKIEGVMASAEDATTLADNIVQLKTMGIAALAKLPPQLGLTPAQIKLLRQALESIKAEAKSDGITARMSLPAKAVALAGEITAKWFTVGAPTASPPVPVPAPPAR